MILHVSGAARRAGRMAIPWSAAGLLTAVLLLNAAPATAQIVAGDRAGLELGPATAPITIVVFSDFECSACAQLAPVLKKLREGHRDRVRVVFKNFPLPRHANARLAHEAAVLAASSGKFWEMHDILFANQSRLDRNSLLEYATQVGLDPARTTKALDQRPHGALIERDIQDGRDLGVSATPTFFVNGMKMVGARGLEALEAAILASSAGASLTSGTDPSPRFDLSNAAFRGSPSAPITIVEFSDLQCPFCAKVSPVIEEMLARFPGRVRWAFKHFPLPFHADAPLAHEAVLAAGQQGRFWEMHDAILHQPSAIKRDDLIKLAGGLGLDVPQFVSHLDSRRFQATVNRDLNEGRRAGVTGTPTFFINGTRLEGAMPASDLARAIEAELARLDVGKAPATIR